MEGEFWLDDIVEKLCTDENNVILAIKELQKTKKKVVLYGAGYCGLETLTLMRKHHILVMAVCDDNREGEFLDNLQIIPIDRIQHSYGIVIFITSGFNKIMKQRLVRLGLIDLYKEIDFGRYDENKENLAYFREHRQEINTAYALLSDAKSKTIFTNLLNYRVSRKLHFLDGLEEDNQYYPREKMLDFSFAQNHTFLDLGAYDGDSILEFVKYVHGKYNRIFAVEASEKNYKMLLANTADISNIECHNIGVYKEKTQLHFMVSDAKNTFASDVGETVLAVDTVDNIVQKQPISFIKMDIEGAEYDALLGAQETIKRDTPILAVSVYHKVEDLFRLILLIQKIHPHYDYYLRHYSPTVIETVLYAVPQKG